MTYKSCFNHSISHLVPGETQLQFCAALKASERFTISCACAQRVPSVDRPIVKGTLCSGCLAHRNVQIFPESGIITMQLFRWEGASLSIFWRLVLWISIFVGGKMVCWRGDRKPDNGLRQYFIFKIFLRQWLTKTIFAYITCVQIIKVQALSVDLRQSKTLTTDMSRCDVDRQISLLA